MKPLLAIAIISALAGCGGKKVESTTPANKTGTADPVPTGSMGGTTYGGGSAAPPAPTGARAM